MTGESVSFGRLHDRLDLLHVVDIERGHAVVVFGGMIEQNSHRDERHGGLQRRWSSGKEGRRVICAAG